MTERQKIRRTERVIMGRERVTIGMGRVTIGMGRGTMRQEDGGKGAGEGDEGGRLVSGSGLARSLRPLIIMTPTLMIPTCVRSCNPL